MANSWALAGDMALWDPWEGTLFVHEGFGVTVRLFSCSRVSEGCRTLFRAPMAVRVGPAGVRVLVHEYLCGGDGP